MQTKIQKLKEKIIRILRWSEKYTKTDMVYLTKNFSWLTMGQVFGNISLLLVAIVFARVLTPQVYGNYKYLISLSGIILAFSLTGLPTAITRAVAQGFEGELKLSIKTSLKWSAGAILMALIGSIYYGLHSNWNLSIPLLIIAFTQPFIQSFGLYKSYLNGKKMFKLNSILYIANTLVLAIALISTLMLTHNPIILVTTFFIITMISTAFSFFYIYKKYIPNIKVTTGVTNYAKHLSVMNMLSTIAMHIDKIIIFQFIGAAELAIYTFAIMIPEQLRGLLKIVSTVIFPKFTESISVEKIKKILRYKMFLISIMLIIISILYYIIAPYLYYILFPKYTDSIYITQLFALSFLAMSSMITITSIKAIGNKKMLYIINISTAFIQIISVTIGVYLDDLTGVVMSRIFTQYFTLILSYILISKYK